MVIKPLGGWHGKPNERRKMGVQWRDGTLDGGKLLNSLSVSVAVGRGASGESRRPEFHFGSTRRFYLSSIGCIVDVLAPREVFYMKGGKCGEITVRITVRRQWLTENSTCGELLLEDEFQCFTLEPPVRTVKPYCIPAGTYRAELLPSPHFGFLTPHVLNVPAFTAIEIHPGNYPRDTHGCCLVGHTHTSDFVGHSQAAFEALMARLRPSAADLSITYVGGTESA